jgi:hypothetical protein
LDLRYINFILGDLFVLVREEAREPLARRGRNLLVPLNVAVTGSWGGMDRTLALLEPRRRGLGSIPLIGHPAIALLGLPSSVIGRVGVPLEARIAGRAARRVVDGLSIVVLREIGVWDSLSGRHVDLVRRVFVVGSTLAMAIGGRRAGRVVLEGFNLVVVAAVFFLS